MKNNTLQWSSKRKKISSAILIAVIFIAMINTPGKQSVPVQVIEIVPGEGLWETGGRLEEMHAIRSAIIFRFWGMLTGAYLSIKPGMYEISAQMSIREVLNLLKYGPAPIELVAREGGTVLDLDSKASEQKVSRPGEIANMLPGKLENDFPFLANQKSFEGFLYPDTYKISYQAGGEAVVRVALTEFSERAWPLLQKRKEWFRVLIIASLLEREVPTYEDRRIVAGVIENRLKLGMPLQLDATVLYSKCRSYSGECARLSRADYSIKSPYNTYVAKGLPPGPIGSPEESAIQAALSPIKSNYLYYLSDPKTRKTHFSMSFNEHNVKRARYLRL